MPSTYYHFTCTKCKTTQPIEANHAIDNIALEAGLCFDCFDEMKKEQIEGTDINVKRNI